MNNYRSEGNLSSHEQFSEAQLESEDEFIGVLHSSN